MNNETPIPNSGPADPSPAKKPRAAANRWRRFYELDNDASFYIGKRPCQKAGLFSYIRSEEGRCVRDVIAPWRKVRTDEPLHVPDEVHPLVEESLRCCGEHTNELCGASQNEERPRVEQPTSDNNITGPTS